MRSSSPERTSKLQLAAEQLSTGKRWIPPKKDTPHPRAKEKSQKDGRKGEIMFRIKPLTHKDAQRAQTNLECTRTQRPTETEPEQCWSISCGGVGQQGPAAEAGALGAVDLGHRAART